KLLGLQGIAQQALELGKISPAHGVLIGRLQPADQEKALAYCLTDNSWQATNGKPNLPKLLKENELVVSEKDLRKFLQSNIHRDLRRAPWDLADKDLVGSASACMCARIGRARSTGRATTRPRANRNRSTSRRRRQSRNASAWATSRSGARSPARWKRNSGSARLRCCSRQ